MDDVEKMFDPIGVKFSHFPRQLKITSRLLALNEMPLGIFFVATGLQERQNF
jgi:Kef-type K+ transport system membrane component KefB